MSTDVYWCLLYIFGHILHAWASGKAPRMASRKHHPLETRFHRRLDAVTRCDQMWRWHVARGVAKAQDVGATKEKPSPARFTFTLEGP
jgi:hypothetical protein